MNHSYNLCNQVKLSNPVLAEHTKYYNIQSTIFTIIELK
jgi:hypothetical protein